MSSAEKDSPPGVPSPRGRTISPVSGAPEGERQLSAQRGGSRWAHTPSSPWCRPADGPWLWGWWTHVRCRAERDLRQEQQNRSQVLSLRKFCLFFLKRRTCQEKSKRAGMGTDFGQSDQKECQGKGGVSFSARRQILGYESPLLAQGLHKFWWHTRTGHHTEQRSWGSRGLWVASHRPTHSLKERSIFPPWPVGWFSWCCRLLF